MPKIACVMMQKDEAFLLRPWLAYHGYLFGFENLFVFDNGSALPEVRATLSEFARKGVHVDWERDSRQDYLGKGDLIGARIASLDATHEYDFLIPLDCDEFILLRTEADFVCAREPILAHLTQLAGEKRILRFPYQLANHPLDPDIYHRFDFFKVFFASGTSMPIDHGHHVTEYSPGMEILETRLVHLHFHYKVFDMKIRQARQSWVGTINVDDREQLAAYNGPSAHLNRLLLQNKDQYYRDFLDKPHFYLPRFRALLAELGAPLDLPVEDVADHLRMHISEADVSSKHDANGVVVIVPATAGSATAPAEFRATRFHERHYLNANPDLIGAGVDPTMHFCTSGFKEGRALRPTDATRTDSVVAAAIVS